MQAHPLLREVFLSLRGASVTELATLESQAAASSCPAAMGVPRCCVFFSTQRPLHQGLFFLVYVSLTHCVNFLHYGEPWELVYFTLLEERIETVLEIARLPWGMLYAHITLQKILVSSFYSGETPVYRWKLGGSHGRPRKHDFSSLSSFGKFPLEKETGVWGSQGEKDKLFFYIA